MLEPDLHLHLVVIDEVGYIPFEADAATSSAGLDTRNRGPSDPCCVTGVVLAAWVGLETLPRLVVRRRQPFQTPDLLRADDALRSWSAHAVTGGLLCLMLGGVGQHVLALAAASDLSALRWVGLLTV